MNRRDLFENMYVEFGEKKIPVPIFDSETHCSNTFKMIRTAAKARGIFYVLINRIPEFNELVISSAEWDRAFLICDFLETAAFVTQNRYGGMYVKISSSFLEFVALERICRLAFANNSNDLKLAAVAMLYKLVS